MSGEMISAASVRSARFEAAGHLAGKPGLDVRDLGVAELGPLGRVEDARRLGANRRPSLGGERDAAFPGLRGEDARQGGLEQRSPSVPRVSSSANAWSIGRTRCSKARSCFSAVALAWPLVKS